MSMKKVVEGKMDVTVPESFAGEIFDAGILELHASPNP